MKVFFGVLVLAVASSIEAGKSSRRDDVISEWLQIIREAPKGRSMSPSWSTFI
jgi:hypothetical protein